MTMNTTMTIWILLIWLILHIVATILCKDTRGLLNQEDSSVWIPLLAMLGNKRFAHSTGFPPYPPYHHHHHQHLHQHHHPHDHHHHWLQSMVITGAQRACKVLQQFQLPASFLIIKIDDDDDFQWSSSSSSSSPFLSYGLTAQFSSMHPQS